MGDKKPTPGKGKAPVRLPQRSEAVSGDESKGLTPIAAAQPTKSKGKPSPVPPPTKAQRAALKRIDKTVVKRMRKR
jgi:hypothetical protein